MNGIISRQEAFRRGLPRYFSGRRCPKGHIAERRTRTYDCVECRKERKRAARRQPAPEICATPPEGPVGPSKSTSSQVTKVEPSSLVLRMNIPTGKITAHFKGARSASVSDDEMIDRLVTGQGKTELIQDWARRSVPGIVQPRPRQEAIWLKQHLPFRWCLEEAMKRGAVVQRIGDVELLEDGTTRTTHHVTPMQGEPYVETTIWEKKSPK